jgi:hypothetical protein
MSNAYTEQNRVWRDALARIAEKLSDADAARPAGGHGWTVAGLLGHIAFWDQRALVLLKKWKAQGISPTSVDVDVVNDAMKPIVCALPAGVISRLVLECARAIDAEIDSLDPAFLARVEAEGKPVRLNRADHRQHHIEQIGKALA